MQGSLSNGDQGKWDRPIHFEPRLWPQEFGSGVVLEGSFQQKAGESSRRNILGMGCVFVVL